MPTRFQGNPHLKQLRVSLDFAQSHPYGLLEDAMDYGRSLVFPRTLLRPMTPALVVTPQPIDASEVSRWLLCCGPVVLLGFALALTPQAHSDFGTLALMIEPPALIFALIALFLFCLVLLLPESVLTGLESLVRLRVRTRTTLPFPSPPETRPCTIAPSLSPNERARFEATQTDFAQVFGHNTTSQRELGGKFSHLVYGRVHPMHIYEDRSYPGEGAVLFNPRETRRVSPFAPDRAHSSKSRTPLKRRLKSFAARWNPSRAVPPLTRNQLFHRRTARFARSRRLSAPKISSSAAPILNFDLRREPYGQHSVTVPDKLRLLSRARSLASSQALSVVPARRCFMMSIIQNDRDKEESSTAEPPSSALVPRPAWMRETPPLVTDDEADRIWNAGTTRLFGPRSSLEPLSFTGGNTLKATAELQHPYIGKHESRVAIDTQSDVTTCLREFLVDIHAIVPDIVEGYGGAANFTEEGTLYV
jgi:hypothetical protein